MHAGMPCRHMPANGVHRSNALMKPAKRVDFSCWLSCSLRSCLFVFSGSEERGDPARTPPLPRVRRPLVHPRAGGSRGKRQHAQRAAGAGAEKRAGSVGRFVSTFFLPLPPPAEAAFCALLFSAAMVDGRKRVDERSGRRRRKRAEAE